MGARLLRGRLDGGGSKSAALAALAAGTLATLTFPRAVRSETAKPAHAATPPAPHGAPSHPAPSKTAHGYGDMVKRWHEPPERSAGVTAEGRPMLALEMINTGERVELRPDRDDGSFSASELDRAAHALRDTRTGNEYPVEPRVLDFAYRIVRHFKVQALRVVSGYRTPVGNGRSNHGRGRAIDLVVPGVGDDAVVRFARSFGYVGVGLYPKSGFIHVDSREQSYFWVQTSWNRIAPVFARDATTADREAVRRGERPPARWAPPGDDVELARAALASRGKVPALAAHADAPDESDEEEGAPPTSARPSP